MICKSISFVFVMSWGPEVEFEDRSGLCFCGLIYPGVQINHSQNYLASDPAQASRMQCCTLGMNLG
jgi:hypothetical protein